MFSPPSWKWHMKVVNVRPGVIKTINVYSVWWDKTYWSQFPTFHHIVSFEEKKQQQRGKDKERKTKEFLGFSSSRTSSSSSSTEPNKMEKCESCLVLMGSLGSDGYLIWSCSYCVYVRWRAKLWKRFILHTQKRSLGIDRNPNLRQRWTSDDVSVPWTLSLIIS